MACLNVQTTCTFRETLENYKGCAFIELFALVQIVQIIPGVVFVNNRHVTVIGKMAYSRLHRCQGSSSNNIRLIRFITVIRVVLTTVKNSAHLVSPSIIAKSSLTLLACRRPEESALIN